MRAVHVALGKPVDQRTKPRYHVKDVQTSIQPDGAECALIAECPLTTSGIAQQCVAAGKLQKRLRRTKEIAVERDKAWKNASVNLKKCGCGVSVYPRPESKLAGCSGHTYKIKREMAVKISRYSIPRSVL